MPASTLQGSLFEEDYLLRTLGAIGSNPSVALTELVANAWDAGASRVSISIPRQHGEALTIKDDGTGLTPDQFRQRWMRLGYNRIKHQGVWADFPAGGGEKKRRAYGRNGVGRHGMLCFADRYTVVTRRGGDLSRFLVAATSGQEPFSILEEEFEKAEGHGTELRVSVARNLPDADRIREVLAARFLHDPEFEVHVNGATLHFSEMKGLIRREKFKAAGFDVEMIVIDSTERARTTQQHGVAFWVGGRLVGEPSWILGDRSLVDRRFTIARRHTIVIKTDDLFDYVLADWSGFRPDPKIADFQNEVGDRVLAALNAIAASRVKETTEAVIHEHRIAFSKMTPLSRIEVAEVVEDITREQPMVSPEMLSLAVRAAIKLENSRSGRALLEKIAMISEDDAEALNRLLSQWTARDALAVLDEIDRRIVVIEALDRLSKDKDVDELATLHPIVAQARWLFGPEYDSPLYASNTTIRRAVEKVFGELLDQNAFVNPRKRPDLLILPDKTTLSAVGVEEINGDSGLSTMSRILMLELKRGGFRVTRKEMDQASGYIEDLFGCGLLENNVEIKCFVVGNELHPQMQDYRTVGSPGNPGRAQIRACTYGQLVRTAEKRLFALREELSSRYRGIGASDLVDRALNRKDEAQLDLSSS
jgi:hypothetical protein